MGCLIVLLALVTPRLPTTTIAYAVARNAFDGVKGWALVVLILGVMVDFGLLGGGGRSGSDTDGSRRD